MKYILYCDALPLMPLRKQFIPRKYYSLLKLFRLSILLATQNEICWKTSECNYPQWGAADAEIKVPSGENTELKRSPFKAWSRSVYSHTCYAYCQGFLPCLFLPFRSIHLHFFFFFVSYHKSFFFLPYLYSVGTHRGNLPLAEWPILFCGPTQEPCVSHCHYRRNRERFWKNASEWIGGVEISQEEISGSKRSMHGYILTYSRL